MIKVATFFPNSPGPPAATALSVQRCRPKLHRPPFLLIYVRRPTPIPMSIRSDRAGPYAYKALSTTQWNGRLDPAAMATPGVV